MHATDQRIRNYNLFGESANLPDVLHCETIAARSVLHNWELAPHRHDRLHQLLLLTSGDGVAEIDGKSLPLPAMTLVNVPPGDVHGFSFQPGTEGWVTTLAVELIDEILDSAAEPRRALSAAFVVPAGEPLRALVAGIADEFSGRHPARPLMLRGLATTLLAQAARCLQTTRPPGPDLTDSHLFDRFRALLEQHYASHWRVADYARALAISPTHLSRITRAATGRPASALIDERIIREARRYLVYTHRPIVSITEELGFTDPAYFSRVFTRVTGQSPRAFRRGLGAADTAHTATASS